MSSQTEAKPAKRLLWGLVIGIVLLNVILFVVYSRSSATSSPPPSGQGHTNAAAPR